MDDTQKYQTAELENARPSGTGEYGDTFRIQVRSDNGQSKWLSVPADRFDAVKAAIIGTEGPTMDTTRVKLAEIRRGALIQTATGFVVAEGIAHTWDDDARMYMRDTDSGRHFPDADGCLTIGIPGFRTDATGKLPGRHAASHILLNPVPGKPPAGLCPVSRDRGNDLAVWSSGTALAGVTCGTCRKLSGVTGTYGKRTRNGI